MSGAPVGSLEEAALKRKEKLENLKRKREVGESNITRLQKEEVLPTPKFRSYKPEDNNFQENVLEDAKPGDVEAEIKDQLNSGKTQVVIDELDITNLAPRKPDWDLKRDVAKKLEKLERRTQRAIAELIRERLKERQANSSNLDSDIMVQ